jgi:two-component system chemotaxis sensor kinase CheA
MTPGPISERLRAIFRDELEDHARSIEHDLLALERDPADGARADLHASLSRSVHSLKGASRVVGEDVIEAACHRLEEILHRLREGLPPDGSLFRLLLATVDAIRQTGAPAGEGSGGVGAVQALLPQLERIAQGSGEDVPVPAAPAAADLPPTENRQVQADNFVRVPVTKLDMLLSRSEELLVARRRAEARDGTLADLQEILRSWRRRWPDIERKVALASGAGASSATSDDQQTQRTQAARQALASCQADLRRLEHDLQAFGDHLAADRRAVEQAANALEGAIRRARLFPFAGACEGLERTARDLADRLGKDVRVVIHGGDLELDRSIIEGLRDPLLHLVRNAVDHGMETAGARRRAGKPATGSITVAARHRALQVEVEVSDDGRGVDLAAVREEAFRRGLDPAGPAETLVAHIFKAGFSTAAAVTPVSGRGVGLDVVKSRMEGMRGAVEVSTEAGRGTRFKLTLPLTLTTIRGLLVAAAGQTFALDTASVRRLLRADPGDIRLVEGRAMLAGAAGPIVLTSLARQLGFAVGERAPGEKIPVVVLEAGGRQAAFAVDALLAEQDLLVRGLGSRLKCVRNVTGATMLADGSLALILHAQDLIAAALAGSADPALAPTVAQSAQVARKRLVLADDSVTTRTLMRTILEGAGYEVRTAADGAEAWRLLQDGGADLVVTDIEMPQMDGITLTRTIRSSQRWRELPVILISALEADDDKARGLRAGATAYLLKSAFDQRELLSVVEQIL